MTINQLHKLTAKLIAAGAGRRGVCVSKDTFTHPLESDGATIVDVEHAGLKSFPMLDDDGGMAVDSRGREKNSVALVLEGSARGDEQLPGSDRSVPGKPDSQPLPAHSLYRDTVPVELCPHNFPKGYLCMKCVEENEKAQGTRHRGPTDGTY